MSDALPEASTRVGPTVGKLVVLTLTGDTLWVLQYSFCALLESLIALWTAGSSVEMGGVGSSSKDSIDSLRGRLFAARDLRLSWMCQWANGL